MIEAIGYLASLGAMSMWFPQTWHVLRRRHDRSALAGVSIPAYTTGVAFNALLAVYGWGSHSTPVGLAGSVNLVLNAVIVAVVGRSRVGA